MEEEIYQSTVVTERTEILVDTTYSTRDLLLCYVDNTIHTPWLILFTSTYHLTTEKTYWSGLQESNQS